MTGEKRYYKIPLLTKLFRIKFYLYWRDDKFYKLGFWRNTMTFEQAILRLESKRLRREGLN
jgi:hypothetical protein